VIPLGVQTSLTGRETHAQRIGGMNGLGVSFANMSRTCARNTIINDTVAWISVCADQVSTRLMVTRRVYETDSDEARLCLG